MVLLTVVVLAGLVAGLARPPLGTHTPRPRLTPLWLLAGGAAGNAGSLVLDGDAAVLSLGVSLVLLIAFASLNRRVTGVAVVGLGLLANLAPVTIDGGMPVRPGALVQAGLVDRADLPDTEVSGPRHLETDDDVLGAFGDALPLPPLREVLSFGDLIIVAGAGDAMRELSRRRARRPVALTPPRHLTGAPPGLPHPPATIDLDAEERPTSTLELAGWPAGGGRATG
ncbi:MAG: DUF5317 family protein [Acidimicrobiales bacterium]